MGDVLELGNFSKKMHQMIGQEVIKNNVDILLTIGTEAKTISDTVKKESEKIEVKK